MVCGVVDRSRWTRGEVIVVVAGLLLAGVLVAVPWHHYALSGTLRQFGVALPRFSYNRTGVQNPQAFLGGAALLVVLAMVAQVAATKLSDTIPPREQLQVVGGALVLGLVVAKLLANRHFLAPGAWLAVVLAAVVAAGGYAISQEVGPAGPGPDEPSTG